MRRLRLALACLVVVLGAGCGSEGNTTADDGSPTEGKQLFTQKCGGCHALRDAGTPGGPGPDLDLAFAEVRRQGFDESTIRDVVRGQISYPVTDPPADAQGMPANIVKGAQADAVAIYVAQVAGVPGTGRTETVGGKQATDAKTIFAQSCGGCHTLAAAGTTGTVGPNLDESKLTVGDAAAQIRNGGDGMPAFEGQLSEQQIETVADYVVSAGGRD